MNPQIGAAISLLLLITLAMAPTTAAATWPDPVVLGANGSPYSGQPVFASTGPSSGVVAYVDRPDEFGPSHVYFRQTNDGGLTWSSAEKLSGSGDAGGPAIVSDGPRVYVAWLEGGLKFRRSTDGGATWRATKSIAPYYRGITPGLSAYDGRVVVSWADWDAGSVMVRVSRDAGRSFSPADKIGTTSSDVGTEAAAGYGMGVIYVAWWADAGHLKIRRSLTNGRTWKAARILDGDGNYSQHVSIATNVSTAVVAYGGLGYGGLRSRSTSDGGSTWAPPDYHSYGDTGAGIAVEYGNGEFHLAYARTLETSSAWYRSSLDGTTWSPSTKAVNGYVLVSSAGQLDGHALVFYSSSHESGMKAIVRREP